MATVIARSSLRTYRCREAYGLAWVCLAGVESFCDVAHFAWLHTNSFARREDAEAPSYD